MTEHFWTVLEKDLFPIPTYIKNGFSMCGFGNPLAFMKVDDDEINFIETSIRERALDLISQQLSSTYDVDCEPLIDMEKRVDFFGENYANDTSNFQFERGDKVLIRELVEHVKQIVNKEGYVRFKFKMKKQKAKRTTKRSLAIHPHRAFKRNRNDSANEFEPTIDKNTFRIDGESDTKIKESRYAELKTKLFQSVQECLKDYKVDQSVGLDSLDENIVDVYMDNADVNIYGGIVCVICRDKNPKKISPKRVFYQESSVSCTWVLSNFHKHLTNVHHLESSKAMQPKCVKQQRKKKLKTISEDDVAGICQIEEIEVDVYNENDSNSVESNNNEKTWLYTQFAAQITEMVTAVLVNCDKTVQMNFLLNKKKASVLTVALIPPDGNCLFGSLVHQIFHHPIGSEDHKNATIKLRAQVVAHILKPENFESYKFTLQNYVYEIKTTNEIEDMTAECKEYVSTVLAREGEWAGAEAIQAVSDIYKINVIVFIENDSFYMNSQKSTYKKTIAIAYRLGRNQYDEDVYNHYDSACDLDASVVYAATDSMVKKMNTSANASVNQCD